MTEHENHMDFGSLLAWIIIPGMIFWVVWANIIWPILLGIGSVISAVFWRLYDERMARRCNKD